MTAQEPGTRERDSTRRSALRGAVAGAVAGLVVGARDGLLRQGDVLARPLEFAGWTSLAMLALAAIGAVIGALAGRFGGRSLRTEPARTDPPWTTIIALTVTALALLLGFDAEPMAGGFVNGLVAGTVLAIAALMAQAGAETWRAPQFIGWALGVLAAGAALFGGARVMLSGRLPGGVGGAIVIGCATIAAAALGWWLVAAIARRSPGRATPVPIVVIALLALAAAVGVATFALRPRFTDRVTASLAEDSTTANPNVILISVDTLRADYVGYAGGPVRTPTMDAIAAESYLFERAYSVAPWTRPSFAAFFAGRYPSEIGSARSLELQAGGIEDIPYTWAADVPLLQESFADAGYFTAAVVTNSNLTELAGAARGFEAFYHCLTTDERFEPDLLGRTLSRFLQIAGVPQLDRNAKELGSAVTEQAEGVLRAIADSGRPSLLWLHYLDPHYPFSAPDATPDRRIEFEQEAAMGGLVLGSGVKRGQTLAAYAAEVEYCDRQLAPVLRALKQTGLWDSSIVVFWSDHGEEFWEHEGFGHGHTYFNELVHVPLLIHMPGQTECVPVTENVSLLDVAPTLLEACRVPAPDGLRGQSLQPAFEGQALADRSIILEGACYGAIRKSIVRGDLKLIYNRYSDEFELYDLTADPGERHNIFGLPDTPDTADMQAQLLAWTQYSLTTMSDILGSEGATDLPPEIREGLRDLGYVN